MERIMTTAAKVDRRGALRIAAGLSCSLVAGRIAWAEAEPSIAAQSRTKLQQLYARSSKARELGERSRAVLVFPSITKGGLLMVGGKGGRGALIAGDKVEAYYRITAASVGPQFGAQKFGYALFFVTQSGLDYLKRSKGWSIGTGPSIVLVDQGMAKTLNTTTLNRDVYAFAFDQKGLMAGLGLEGTKISQIKSSA
jgi:lipid-binding SYLF domain-containing protein